MRYEVQPAELTIDGYDCFSNCFSEYVHRGVAVYVKKSLNAQKVCLTHDQAKARECVWVEVKLKDGDVLLIGGIYRPPSNTVEQNKHLYKTILSITEGKSHVLLGGDFNHPEINWKEETSPNSENNPATIFMDSFVRNSFLFQHVSKPTHYRPQQNPTLIDLIFSSEKDMVQNLRHEAPLGKSHHHCLHFDFVCYAEMYAEKGRIYNFKKANFHEMRNHITNSDLMSKIDGLEVQETWNCIEGCIIEAIDKSVPKFKPQPKAKTDNKRERPEWWNKYVGNKVKLKKELYQKWLVTQNPKDWDAYARIRNKCKNECRKSDRNYQKSIAKKAKDNPKIFYAYTNRKMKVKEGIGDLIDDEGEKVTSNEGKAKLLNNFFCSVFTTERMEDIPSCENKNPNITLEDIVFTKEIVYKKLKEINPAKSCGPDNITAVVLKELAQVLTDPITELFNKSMSKGELPKVWKEANVVPLFKKGEKSRTNNYRPVSLTCILCKIMESIIRDKAVEYMEANNYLSSYQHGFISKRSCTTNLLATMDAWTEALDRGSAVDAVYLDFSKAFDSVPHLRLLEKLKGYGFKGKILAWIADFLIGRRQRVCVNACYSDWEIVTSGVPQGSVLGPILFVIFINDLPETVQSLCQMYADDSKVYSEVENETMKEKLQADLDNLMVWANKWQMRFNADKCHVVHLGQRNCNFSYYMGKQDTNERVELTASLVEKDLGVQVDSELTFSKHIECQVNKANKLVGLIRRSFSYIDKESMRQLFTALVRPHLEFANVIWSPRFQKDIKLIEKVQRRATKVVPGLKNMKYEQRLRAMNLPSLKYRRKRGDLIEAYKLTHGLYSVNQGLLKLDENKRTRGHAYKVVKESCNSSIRQRFFSSRVVNDWNGLPASIAEASSMDSFKARLDKHFENEMFCD